MNQLPQRAVILARSDDARERRWRCTTLLAQAVLPGRERAGIEPRSAAGAKLSVGRGLCGGCGYKLFEASSTNRQPGGAIQGQFAESAITRKSGGNDAVRATSQDTRNRAPGSHRGQWRRNRASRGRTAEGSPHSCDLKAEYIPTDAGSQSLAAQFFVLFIFGPLTLKSQGQLSRSRRQLPSICLDLPRNSSGDDGDDGGGDDGSLLHLPWALQRSTPSGTLRSVTTSTIS